MLLTVSNNSIQCEHCLRDFDERKNGYFWYSKDMSAIGKELEPKINADDLAVKEVEGYVERIEKQSESRQPTVPTPTPQPTGVLSDTAAMQAVSLAPKSAKQVIVLPLDEEGVKKGLHHKVWEAIRWLAEWSIYMIKKYPGKVFYPVRRGENQPKEV